MQVAKIIQDSGTISKKPRLSQARTIRVHRGLRAGCASDHPGKETSKSVTTV